jgi:GNAT superfamily N-acetyltransferase
MVEEPKVGLMVSVVRTMKPSDVSSAMELSIVANWNQTPADWHRIMQLFTEGCRCIEKDGRIVATATLLPYGTHLAWIGMVLTRPEYRRQGLARRLMEDAIASAEQRRILALKLDATDEGRPLYESLGFVVEQKVERWGCDGGELVTGESAVDFNNISSYDVRISDEMFAQDAKAFGVARRLLLEELSSLGRCDVTSNGYVFSRPGRTAQYLGPCVADSEAKAGELIAAHLEYSMRSGKEQEGSRRSSWYWDLLPANVEAVRCAVKFGFTRRRTLWRMRRGEAITNKDAMVYAIAGLELG